MRVTQNQTLKISLSTVRWGIPSTRRRQTSNTREVAKDPHKKKPETRKKHKKQEQARNKAENQKQKAAAEVKQKAAAEAQQLAEAQKHAEVKQKAAAEAQRRAEVQAGTAEAQAQATAEAQRRAEEAKVKEQKSTHPRASLIVAHSPQLPEPPAPRPSRMTQLKSTWTQEFTRIMNEERNMLREIRDSDIRMLEPACLKRACFLLSQMANESHVMVALQSLRPAEFNEAQTCWSCTSKEDRRLIFGREPEGATRRYANWWFANPTEAMFFRPEVLAAIVTNLRYYTDEERLSDRKKLDLHLSDPPSEDSANFDVDAIWKEKVRTFDMKKEEFNNIRHLFVSNPARRAVQEGLSPENTADKTGWKIIEQQYQWFTFFDTFCLTLYKEAQFPSMVERILSWAAANTHVEPTAKYPLPPGVAERFRGFVESMKKYKKYLTSARDEIIKRFYKQDVAAWRLVFAIDAIDAKHLVARVENHLSQYPFDRGVLQSGPSLWEIREVSLMILSHLTAKCSKSESVDQADHLTHYVQLIDQYKVTQLLGLKYVKDNSGRTCQKTMSDYMDGILHLSHDRMCAFLVMSTTDKGDALRIISRLSTLAVKTHNNANREICSDMHGEIGLLVVYVDCFLRRAWP